MSIELKIATFDNLDELLPLVRAYHCFEGINLTDAERKEALRPLLADKPVVGRSWLILSSGSLVGYIAVCFGYSIEFRGRDAFVDEFYLIEPARGKGVGTKVLEQVKSEAARLGILALHLEVELNNDVAKRLYSGAGFELRDGFHLMSCYLESYADPGY